MSRVDRLLMRRDYDGEDDDDAGEVMVAEGKVTKVATDGISFTIAGFDDDRHEWGPAPYGRWSTGGTGPAIGDRCLVLFPKGTTVDPWVVGWWPS